MTVLDILARQARSEAQGRAASWAWRFALVGVVFVAVVLFCERAGLQLPGFNVLFRLVAAPDGDGAFLSVLGWVAISLDGLTQAGFLVGGVLAAGIVLRFVLVPVLRRSAGATAALLDRRLSTDVFESALEADGPFGPLVAKDAVKVAPAEGFLRGREGRRRQRALMTVALALVVAIALLPGVSGASEGSAPVDGAPDPGQRENLLRLALSGPTFLLKQGSRIPLELLGETSEPPSRDLDLAVEFVLDDEHRIDPNVALFFPAGARGVDSLPFDLGKALPELAAGDHSIYATAGGARSNVFEFRIEGEEGGGGKGPEEKKDEEKPPPPPQGNGGAPLPEARPRFVEPLIRDGEKVRKRARVPIEVQGGGAPRASTLEEAWPDMERRKEAALNRPGLSPSARELVRRYFDSLRPPEEKGTEKK